MSSRVIDWSKTDLLRELGRNCSVEVRACVWKVRGMNKTVFYDPSSKTAYVVIATVPLDDQWPPKVNAQRISNLVNCVPPEMVK